MRSHYGVNISCGFISDIRSEKILSFFPASDKISSKYLSSFCRERKLLGTGLFSNILFLISLSEVCFKNLALVHSCNYLLNFHLFIFPEDLLENLDVVYSSWDIFSFEDSDDEPSSISKSSDKSLLLSLADSSKDEMYFHSLDPLSFFLGDYCILFSWPSLLFCLDNVMTIAI